MFHTPFHKTAPGFPNAGQLVNQPYANDPRVIVERQVDIRIDAHGSIIILNAVSDAGREWCEENIAHAQRWGANGYVAEPRYVEDIVGGMVRDALEVTLDAGVM